MQALPRLIARSSCSALFATINSLDVFISHTDLIVWLWILLVPNLGIIFNNFSQFHEHLVAIVGGFSCNKYLGDILMVWADFWWCLRLLSLKFDNNPLRNCWAYILYIYPDVHWKTYLSDQFNARRDMWRTGQLYLQ